LAETDSVDLQMAVAGVVLAIAYIGVNPSPRAYFDFCVKFVEKRLPLLAILRKKANRLV
jgi:hypothetical protein